MKEITIHSHFNGKCVYEYEGKMYWGFKCLSDINNGFKSNKIEASEENLQDSIYLFTKSNFDEKAIYNNAIAIEQVEDEWIFECNGHKWKKNLSTVLNEDVEIKKGTEFKISSLALESSDLVEVFVLQKEKVFDCDILEISGNEIKFRCDGKTYRQEIDTILTNFSEKKNLKVGGTFRIGELLLSLIDPI